MVTNRPRSFHETSIFETGIRNHHKSSLSYFTRIPPKTIEYRKYKTSKAFDCIPHDLLIAKLYAYGLSEEITTFFYSYLKRRG